MRSLVRVLPAVVLVAVVAVLTDVRAGWWWYAAACAGVAVARQALESRLVLASVHSWDAPQTVADHVLLIARQAGVPAPRVRAVAAGSPRIPYAAAYGSGANAVVLVSDALVGAYDAPRTHALLARAVSRLRPTDVVRRALFSVVQVLTIGALTGATVQALLGWTVDNDGSLLAFLLVGYALAMAGLVTIFVSRRLTASAEVRADDLAAMITSPAAVLEALSGLDVPASRRQRLSA